MYLLFILSPVSFSLVKLEWCHFRETNSFLLTYIGDLYFDSLAKMSKTSQCSCTSKKFLETWRQKTDIQFLTSVFSIFPDTAHPFARVNFQWFPLSSNSQLMIPGTCATSLFFMGTRRCSLGPELISMHWTTRSGRVRSRISLESSTRYLLNTKYSCHLSISYMYDSTFNKHLFISSQYSRV